MKKIALATAALLALGTPVLAESGLDKVIAAKAVRCGVMLDNPPAGYRNAKNEPDGMDVAYCDDIAKALGVKPVIVEITSSERVPSLVSGRIDVLINATPTPARMMSVAFTQPFMNNTMGVITRADTGIRSYDDLKSHKLGGVIGSTPEQLLMGGIKSGWDKTGATYTGYGSDSESFLALQQGKVDALVFTIGVYNALKQSGQFPELTLAGLAPLSDYVSIGVQRSDQEFLNWMRLFVWQQSASGRYEEVYHKYFGDAPVPDLTVAGVDY